MWFSSTLTQLTAKHREGGGQYHMLLQEKLLIVATACEGPVTLVKAVKSITLAFKAGEFSIDSPHLWTGSCENLKGPQKRWSNLGTKENTKQQFLPELPSILNRKRTHTFLREHFVHFPKLLSTRFAHFNSSAPALSQSCVMFRPITWYHLHKYYSFTFLPT